MMVSEDGGLYTASTGRTADRVWEPDRVKRHFDAILIDFYGTIAAGDREAVEATCCRVVETLGLPIAPLDFAIRWGEVFFAAIDSSNGEAFRTLHECELASLTETLAQFDQSGDAADFVTEIEHYWRNPPVYTDAIEFLKRVPIPVCCVSNADTEPILMAIEKHGLSFDAVVTSEQARSYKPDPVIFEQALATLGVAPERTVHIGDSLHSDVQGASQLGIRTVWLQRESRIHDIGDCQPNWIIDTFNSFDGVLGLC